MQIFPYLCTLIYKNMLSFCSVILSISLLTGNSVTKEANISVQIKDLDSHKIIEEHRPQNVVPPASVMKTLTTAAMLELYGPDFQFTTTLEYTGKIEDEVLHGDLIVRGGCDPSLGDLKKGQRFYNQWIQAVRKAGIKKIDGNIIADMSLLDAEAQNPGWLMEDAANYYAPGVFSLNYMSNTLNIVLKSGPVGSVADVIRTEPLYEDLRVINHVRCTEITYDGAYVYGLPYSNERYISGSVPSNQGQFGVKSDIPNPGLLLVKHFKSRLEGCGIEVSGEATYRPESFSKNGRTLLYEHYSEPLRDLIAHTNIYSDNLYAEAMFRYMGLAYGMPGTVHNSCEFLRAYWQRKKVDLRSAIIKDGCGLAPQDAISAEMFVQLLEYMSKSKYYDDWLHSLPICGKTGTVSGLFRGTALEGRVWAKSGTIAGTKNYAGYIFLPDGRKWAFAILVNSANGKARNIQRVIQDYLLDVYKTHR